MSTDYGILDAEWTRKSYGYGAVDLPQVFGVKYIGSEDSGTVEAAATTGDLTLKHGDLSSEAVDSTVGASGVLDLTIYTTVKKVVDAINLSDNWEAWYIDYLPDQATNISAGNGIFPTVSAQQAKVTGGYQFVADTSLETAEFFPVGVTFEGEGTKIHNHDASVLHEILEIRANITFGGATAGIFVYACDDFLGTKTQIGWKPLVSNTATTFELDGEPLYATVGKRIVVEAKDASGAISSPSLYVSARSAIIGPTVNKKKLWCRLSL